MGVAIPFSGIGGNGAALGASAPGPLPAGARPAASSLPPYTVDAEAVASSFIVGYEGYSYADGPTAVADRVAPYVTPALHAVLAAPSQGGAGASLVAEKVVASASATATDVVQADPTHALLLVTASIDTTSSNGSSVTMRYVPLSLTNDGSGWRVDDVDGLMTHVPPAPPPPAPNPVPAPVGHPGPAPVAPPARPPAAPAHLAGIPDDYLSWYEEASTTCPGLSWAVLAAVGTVESDNGRSSLPGVHSGANYAGAEGPMQFLPSTFSAYGVVAPGGAAPPSPYDPPDAIWSAARLLCADGAGTPAGLYGAVFAYNHSAAYVSAVLALAGQYQARAGEKPTASGSIGLGSVIVRDAEAFLGTPYVWGGENPRVGFDCSGLVQWVMAEAGIDMPRVAQAQYDAGPRLPGGAELYAGDLVFFGSGPRGVEHVGIYVGGGKMIDAPHTGAVVRIEPVAGFSPAFVGATRPEIPDVSSSGPGLPVVVGAAGSHPAHAGPARSGPERSAPERTDAPKWDKRPRPAGPDRTDPAAPPAHHRHHPGAGVTTPTGDPTSTTAGDTTATARPRSHHHHHDGTPSTTTTWLGTTSTTVTADPTGVWTETPTRPTSTSSPYGSTASTPPPPVHHRHPAPTTTTSTSTDAPGIVSPTTQGPAPSTTSTTWHHRSHPAPTTTTSTSTSTSGQAAAPGSDPTSSTVPGGTHRHRHQ
ncbi:MAG TPA: NlpC/P60 family protein [Acidimicrobiales bacterium]|nr:NlpC/P60 family protein [Acidimicrobiales bacterium]